MNEFVDLKDELLVAISELFSSDFFVQLTQTQQGEIAVLLFIYRYSEPTNPSLISDCLSISRARVTAIITSLSEKGLVRYEHSKIDRRRLMVVITDKGIEKIKERLDKLENRILNILIKLGLERSQTFIDIITEIVNNVEEERKLNHEE